jgi:predicted ArsR family transcriptional regulator
MRSDYPLQQLALDALRAGLVHADEIADKIGRPANQVRVALDRLRVAGAVVHCPAINGRERVTWRIRKPCLLAEYWKGVSHD